MGFLDKVKGAVNAVTGGAANVTIEYPKLVFAGEPVTIKITAVSTGSEIKSKGVFVDLLGEEHIEADAQANGQKTHVNERQNTFNKDFQIAQPFTLAPNETKTWEGTFTLPPSSQPTYEGAHAKHTWQIRGRIEAFGNDPDSGFLALRVGKKD